MEAAVRWSNISQDSQKFLIADVAGNRLQICEIEEVVGRHVNFKTTCHRDRLPNFTAFNWCRHDESLVAIGTSLGESKLLRIEPDRPSVDIQSFPVKLQRKANSLAFSKEGLLAVGLDRIRGDSSLNIYDLGPDSVENRSEPIRRLTGAEVITNVKFFNDQPQTLLAGSGGVARHGQNLKLYDLRGRLSPYS